MKCMMQVQYKFVPVESGGRSNNVNEDSNFIMTFSDEASVF
jgi:hypothetical protein